MQIAKLVPLLRGGFSTMSTWTDAETTELVTLWPTSSARQIAAQLKRSRAAVSRKAQRLALDGVLPRCGAKHFTVPPVQRRPGRGNNLGVRHREVQSTQDLAGAVPPKSDRLDMRPCAFAELDDGRCHWPIDSGSRITTVFCGGVTALGRRYCGHHLRMARG
jgi:hypothetical protein